MIQRRAGNDYPISYKEKPITEKIAAISREASIDQQTQNSPGKPPRNFYNFQKAFSWALMRVLELSGVQV